MKLKKTDKEGVFKNIFIAYFILLFHVVLLAGIAVFVVLIKGFFEYLPWIMAGAGLLIGLCNELVYRLSAEPQIQDILANDQLKNRNVEISFMGGLASFKINTNEEDTSRLLMPPDPDSHPPADIRLIETDTDRAERKMNQLNALYEKDLITKEEFDKARQSIIQG